MSSLRQLGSFALVGSMATLGYAGLAWLMTVHWGWWPALASALAYAACGVFSYASHKWLTFQSRQPLGDEFGRFVFVTALGYSVAFGIPLVLTHTLQLSPGIAIAVVCLVCPALNYLLLNHFVFTKSKGQIDGSGMAI